MEYREFSLDDLFEPPEEPDASRPVRERTQYTGDGRERLCVNAGANPLHAGRPAPHPGPRCATCHREHRKAQKKSAKDRRVETTFELTPDEYNALYEYQGGRCYVCRKASGRAKRLAVDHDHVLAFIHGHEPGKGCKKCLRGLACGWCNRDVLGRLGGNPETFERIAAELRNPPAQRLFGDSR